MEVIFIKDTRENPAYKQIKTITTDPDYVDAYVTFDKINYFSKLPNAPIGAYIYNQRLGGTLQHFELETLSPKKLRRLSWIDYRLIQVLQTGVYYVPQKFTDELKKVTIDYFFVRYQIDIPQWFIDFLKEHNIKSNYYKSNQKDITN